MGLSFAEIDLGQIFSGLGSAAKDIRTAITGIDPTIAGQVNLKLVELETKIAEAEPILAQAQAADRTSARSLEAEYVKQGKINWLQQFLAYGSIILLACFIIALFKFTIKPEVRDMLNIVLGGLLKIVYDIYGYYFGGSLGSSTKNQMISGIVAKLKN